MKTLQELYNETMASDELRKEFPAATKANTVPDFVKDLGRNVSYL